MKSLRLICLLLVVMTGCATVTPYQSEQTGGGYIDLPLSEGRYKISVRGNGWTDRQHVYNIAQVRAAEITLANGKTHFLILDSSDKEKNHTEYTAQQFTNVKNHYVKLVIKPTNDASLEGAIDARAKIRDLGPLVGYMEKIK